MLSNSSSTRSRIKSTQTVIWSTLIIITFRIFLIHYNNNYFVQQHFFARQVRVILIQVHWRCAHIMQMSASPCIMKNKRQPSIYLHPVKATENGASFSSDSHKKVKDVPFGFNFLLDTSQFLKQVSDASEYIETLASSALQVPQF